MCKTLKKAFLFFVPILCLPLTVSTAAAAIPAHTYIFSNLGEGGAAVIQQELTEMGYASEVFFDLDAETIISDMGNLAVFSYIGHGNPGRLVCRGDSIISAKEVPGRENTFSLERFYAPSGLVKNRLVYYGSCHSDSDGSEYGRLTTYTASLGANAVIGFEGSVMSNVATYFEEALFAIMENGETAETAIYLAKAEANAQYKGVFEYSKVDTAAVYGSGTIKLVPAAFGESIS